MLSVHLVLLSLVVFSSGIGGFGVGIWIYQTSGSIAAFTMVGIATFLPAFLLTPLSGVLVDRVTPKRAILYSSAISSLGFLILAGLLHFNLGITAIMFPLFFMGAFSAFQGIAYHTMIAQTSDPESFQKMNGFIGIGHSLTLLGSPILAAFLMEIVDVSILALIPCIASMIQFTALLFFDTQHTNPKKRVTWNFLKELQLVINFMRGRKDMLLLMSFSILLISMSEILHVLITPLGLELFDQRRVGFLAAIGGLGSLLGNIVLTVLSRLTHKIRFILVIHFFQGLLLICLTKTAMTFVFVGLALWIFFMLEAIYEGIDLAYWQEHAPEGMQASVLSFKAWSTSFSTLLAYIGATPLVAFISDNGFFKLKEFSEFSLSATALIATITSLGFSNLVLVLLYSIVFALVLNKMKKNTGNLILYKHD